MKKFKILFLTGSLSVFMFTASGCALLQIPVTLLEGTFGLLQKIFTIAGKMPMPPPGVFGN